MNILHPRIEAGYPENCVTLEDAIQAIQKVFAERIASEFRVTSFEIKVVTRNESTMRFAFDRKNVTTRHEA